MTGVETCHDVLYHLLESHVDEILAVHVFTVPYPPIIAPSDLAVPESEIAHVALQVREDTVMPFWDAVIEGALRLGASPSQLLHRMQFHQSPRLVRIAASDCARQVPSILDSLAETEILVLASLVEAPSGERRHIPMIDFHLPTSDAAMPLVLGALQELRLSGWVLDSGRSYHFIGRDLLPLAEFQKFLGRLVLCGPIVDRYWVGHQLIGGVCGLRISSRSEYGGCPRVICHVTPEVL